MEALLERAARVAAVVVAVVAVAVVAVAVAVVAVVAVVGNSLGGLHRKISSFRNNALQRFKFL